MNEICAFSIDRRWPAEHPDRIQLYASPGGLGVAVSIMLEETGLQYELHAVDGGADENHSPELLSLDPEGSMPAIIDPDGPDDAPLLLSDPGAILLYLSEKTGKLMPPALSACYQTIEWVFFQRSMVATGADDLARDLPADGPGETGDLPPHRQSEASLRLLNRVESRLRGRDWIMDHGYSIADISMLDLIRHAAGGSNLAEGSGLQNLSRVADWMERCLARPAVQRGIRAFETLPGAGPAGRRPTSGMPAF